MVKAFQRAKIVDGYTALKVARKSAGSEPRPLRVGKREGTENIRSFPTPTKLAANISHTTMPSKWHVVCYDCRFEFHQIGRTQSTVCPKCRKEIFLIDYTLDSEWTDTLKTAGTIHLTKNGVLKAGELGARKFILDGPVEGGTIFAFDTLVIGPNAKFKEASVSGLSLVIEAGAKAYFRRKMELRDVEVFGDLRARINASGTVTVHPGGFLKGELHSQHLRVDEGGGLKAKLEVRPILDTGIEQDAAPLEQSA